jgi:hypothetical protein
MWQNRKCGLTASMFELTVIGREPERATQLLSAVEPGKRVLPRW